MKESSKARRRKEKGFSLLEMVIASAILLVGVLSVVQLVPASLKSNLYNRMDTMATVVAQRELDQMLNQLQNTNPPQTACPNTGLSTASFSDKNGNSVSLGNLNCAGGWSGAPIVMQGPAVVVDFSQNPVNGYSILGYQDVNDPNYPNAPQFELRWAVFTVTNNSGTVVGKRIIVGCRQTNAAQPMLPINLDTSVQR